MNDAVYQFRKWIRRGLAGTLFTALLLGASVAALSAFAAGVNALAGIQRAPAISAASGKTSQAQTVTVPVEEPQQNAQTTPSGQANTASVSVAAQTQTSTTDQMNTQLDHMGSPIGQELDAGGIALGETVQRSFGNMLSGLVQSLLLGQPSGSQSGDQR